jgi:SAM-dependent methyltransferase
MNDSRYDAAYYQTANYDGYLDRRDRYLRTAAEIVDTLTKFKLLDRATDTILDYGCGPGFLLDGFELLGYAALGVEVSEWARKRANDRGRRVVTEPQRASVLVALDVLEHMTDADCERAVASVDARVAVVRVPCSTDGGRTFHLEVSRRDPTHINCKTKQQWVDRLRELGYATVLPLNLYTIYDTDGVACMLAVRETP